MTATAQSTTNLLETLYADAVRLAQASPVRQKKLGQYFTDPRVADFMSNLVEAPRAEVVRVLDPGAGTGILGISTASTLLHASVPSVKLYAVEKDPALVPQLRLGLQTIKEDFPQRFSFELLEHDFLELAEGQLGLPRLPAFHIAVSNPPYFKMSPKRGPGGSAPNAYARFMEMSARLLEPQGQLCFIVPRSFTSGFYFRGFRRSLHERLSLTAIHTFDSRADLFRHQEVLQENLIVLYKRSDPPETIQITASANHHDLRTPTQFRAPHQAILSPGEPTQNIRVPASEEDLELLRFFDGCDHRLADFGLEISTGPVVPFRATDFLVSEPEHPGSLPLLWLQHVSREQVVWPIGPDFRKPERISGDAPAKLLVPNKTYVLLRRFSAKEDVRRLTAAVLVEGLLAAPEIGLENHLNFIHKPSGELTSSLARGLSTLLNSRLYDRYFRITNGNTQVGAADIRALPLPTLDVLQELGARANKQPSDPDQLVIRFLGPPRQTLTTSQSSSHGQPLISSSA